MAKEPVEDTDPSTLSFNVVGYKLYMNGDNSCYSFFPFVAFLWLSINMKIRNPKFGFPKINVFITVFSVT